MSACDDEALDCIANIYNNIVDAGVELVSCIKVAEASKVLENTQRNVNIALMNEMAMLFSAMDIDMTEVLKAASTKWNFVNYSPDWWVVIAYLSPLGFSVCCIGTEY